MHTAALFHLRGNSPRGARKSKGEGTDQQLSCSARQSYEGATTVDSTLPAGTQSSIIGKRVSGANHLYPVRTAHAVH